MLEMLKYFGIFVDKKSFVCYNDDNKCTERTFA
jgi:hypothetical protein